MAFVKAERKKSKLRLGLTGPAGSGKTYGALLIASGLGGKIAVIDTEHGSASLYANEFDFDVMELEAPYSPEAYIKAIRDAEGAGYDILIIDSTTHEWSGVGGCLEINEKVAQAKFRGNTWSAWNETTPRHRKFIDAILQSRMHVIATMRSKTETTQSEDTNGKKKVVKLGMKAEQREGTEYEMTVVLDIAHDGHYALATKDRTRLFNNADPKPIAVETGTMLLNWLNSGKVVKMTEQEIADHTAAIESCGTLEELKVIFAAAYRAANHIDDQDALKTLTTVKDAQKSKIESSTQEGVAEFDDIPH